MSARRRLQTYTRFETSAHYLKTLRQRIAGPRVKTLPPLICVASSQSESPPVQTYAAITAALSDCRLADITVQPTESVHHDGARYALSTDLLTLERQLHDRERWREYDVLLTDSLLTLAVVEPLFSVLVTFRQAEPSWDPEARVLAARVDLLLCEDRYDARNPEHGAILGTLRARL